MENLVPIEETAIASEDTAVLAESTAVPGENVVDEVIDEAASFSAPNRTTFQPANKLLSETN
jgi:hypothetical protein